MKDKLDKIFELQRRFDDELITRRKLHDIDRTVWIQKEVLAIVSELSELLDEVNFKWWKNPKPLNEQAIKGELVDILHFFISMCIKMNMTAEELYSLYIEKNKENFDRQNGLSQKEGYYIGNSEE